MRDYGKVHTSFWSSATIRSMSEDARNLAMYLLTCPHSTIAGVFRLPDGYVCEDLQWTSERVNQGFAELLAKGYANRCETTKWVWVCKHLEWNKPENPNQCKSAAKVASGVPDECTWKLDFMRVCGPLLGLSTVEVSNPSATVPQPFLNQEQKQEQKQNKTTARSASVEPPEGVSLKTWTDFLKLRKAKRAPLTETALDGIRVEADKAGYTLEQALSTCCLRGWQGFEADWVAGKAMPRQAGGMLPGAI